MMGSGRPGLSTDRMKTAPPTSLAFVASRVVLFRPVVTYKVFSSGPPKQRLVTKVVGKESDRRSLPLASMHTTLPPP